MKTRKLVNTILMSATLCLTVSACGALKKGAEAAEAAKGIFDKIENGDLTGAADSASESLEKYSKDLGTASVSCADLAEFEEGYKEGSGGSTPSEDLNALADELESVDPDLAAEARDTADAYDQAQEDCDERDTNSKPTRSVSHSSVF